MARTTSFDTFGKSELNSDQISCQENRTCMDPLSLGRDCYKQRDYEGALLAFSEGIKISTGYILLTALDHRAATFEKLNQLQQGLRDAKEMIELEPGLAKGYLRCAKILQLKGQEKLALKIYERGLKKVKVGGDPDRTLLQEMFNKLQQKGAPARNFDPMVMLPPELAKIVCEHLDMRDRVICLAVSKPWKRFLETSHDLWTVLDLRSARRFVRLDSIKAHMRRSNYGLDKAILTGSPQVLASGYLERITRLSKKLRHLEISSAGFLSDSLLAALPNAENLRVLIVLGASISLDSVVKALGFCPQVQTTRFSAVTTAPVRPYAIWPQLDSLTSLRIEFRVDCDPTRFGLNQLILSTPNLKSASLVQLSTRLISNEIYRHVDFEMWSKLEHLEVPRGLRLDLFSLPHTLKYLDLSENILPQFAWVDGTPTSINLPQLETLLCGWVDLSIQDMWAVIEASVKAGNLKNLHVSEFSGIRTNFSEQSIAMDSLLMPSLEGLSLRKCWLREDDIIRFLCLCPNLQYLELCQARVTGVAIREVMTREIGPLKWLSVTGCAYLSSDAVDWARSLGTVVEYNNDPMEWPAGQRFWRDRPMT